MKKGVVCVLAVVCLALVARGAELGMCSEVDGDTARTACAMATLPPGELMTYAAEMAKSVSAAMVSERENVSAVVHALARATLESKYAAELDPTVRESVVDAVNIVTDDVLDSTFRTLAGTADATSKLPTHAVAVGIMRTMMDSPAIACVVPLDVVWVANVADIPALHAQIHERAPRCVEDIVSNYNQNQEQE